MIDLGKLVGEHKDLITQSRRDLHMIREPGYTEKKTSAYVAGYLNREGLEVQTGIAQTGFVGEEQVIEPEPTMGGEDMVFHLENSKGCFFFLGVGREGCAPLHNPKFDLNEDVLLTGVEIYCRVAFELLG